MVITMKLKSRSRESAFRCLLPHVSHIVEISIIFCFTNALGTHGIGRILQIDRDLCITCMMKNLPVRDWLDLRGNLVERRDIFLLKKKIKIKFNYFNKK